MKRNEFLRHWRRERHEWLAFAAFVFPNLVLFGVFTYWPVLNTAWMSMRSGGAGAYGTRFALFENYWRLFADPVFWRVILNTLVFAAAVIVIAQCVAFGVALLLNRRLCGRVLFRTLAFLPYVTTPAAAALVWVVLLDPQYGPLGAVYRVFGLEAVNLLERSGLALGALILVGAWKEIGIASLFFLAGFQNLPEECYEAANLEGASAWARLRHITVPLMSPVLFFLAVSGFIAAAKAFDIVVMMTEGGPVYPASSTFVYHLYRVAFQDYDFGYASAFAMVFFILFMALTVLKLRMGAKWVHYDG